MGEALAFLSACGYTFQLILIKKGNNQKSTIGSIPIQLIVLSSGILMFLVIYSIKIHLSGVFTVHNQFFLIPKEAMIFVVMDGLLGPMGGMLLLTKATEFIGPSRTSVFRGTNPIFAAILSSIILKESPGWAGVLGITLLVVGIVVISMDSGSSNDNNKLSLKSPMKASPDPEQFENQTSDRNGSRLFEKRSLGIIMALISGLLMAIAQTSRGVAISRGAAAEPIVFWGAVISFTTLMAVYYLNNKSHRFTAGIDGASMKYYLCAGIGFVIGSSALALSFVYIDVWKAVAIRNMQPILSIMVSWHLLKKQELIDARVIVGALLVTSAIWIFFAV